jgi:general secretion pathway protein F
LSPDPESGENYFGTSGEFYFGIDTLQTIGAQEGQRAVAEICFALRADILDGAPLSQALSQHPRVFSPFFVTSVSAGEDNAAVGRVLRHLADHAEQRAKNIRAIQLALLYPALLLIVSALIVTGLLVFVVPDIVAAFAARGADLPGLTQALIWLSDGLTKNALALVSALGLLSAGICYGTRLAPVQRALHRWLATRRPVCGFTRQIATQQFSSTLALLLGSGVTLADALGSAQATVGNQHIRAQLGEVTQQVREGASLHSAMERTGLFSPLLILTIASGTQSGALPQTMRRSAEDQTAELKAKLAALVGLAEPLILLVMGGIVMLLVMAILLPIINLNSLVG